MVMELVGWNCLQNVIYTTYWYYPLPMLSNELPFA